MDTPNTSIGNGTSTNTSHLKQHKSSSSLGSLYEVLADLDDTQLQYLIQEMNHTGHRNVPVSQAVSALEAQAPLSSLSFTTPRTSDPVQEPQRRLSKSQQGKLRLQTAFRRTPSLQQGRHGHTGSHGARDANVDGGSRGSCSSPSTVPTTQSRESAHKHSGLPEASDGTICSANLDSQKGHWLSRPPTENKIDAGAVQPPIERTRREGPTYRRIPRPDFSLPEGVTVVDLLHLLEVEYLSSNSSRSSSPSSTSSPSSLSSPFPTQRLVSGSKHLNQLPIWPGSRPLRRHTSRLDMALDVERSASGAMEIGMGMLEPRELRSASLGAPAFDSMGRTSLDTFERNFKGEMPSFAPPIVYEGIFDVLENQ
ncbi:hypothetical protein CGRA01v4_13189 [Colletotrichum graminicola]|uniref:Uncharacterized protein n=1 Tax=Colletotrichum graminicola (strain M1.001 / M2 / FGSC 10212) TaxID=645133 RepID=E3R0Z9_COLGM|nr:uncharacterized protein GLRG_11934 [Colletotrichum graminicola M1.001]EFQ36787.1 hypothetical protein GLRG_11934 [Colletotrichum graminicola M1.001]WDK21899.1 hypothetical protein CGRA01v4_13189 [Colletotrichum graminicola]